MKLTFKERTHGPDPDWALTGELARAHLKEEYRETHAEQRYEVRYQECP